MQSFSNFTVGGSIGVNCHGRYVGRGPLVNSVRAVQLITAEGEVLELSRTSDSELFGAVFGGYGGLGVVTEVELDLDRNTPLERVVDEVSLEAYPSYFRRKIRSDPRFLLHNANLLPPDSERLRAISWVLTDKPVTVPDRLIPRDADYDREQNAIWAVTELPGGQLLREELQQKWLDTETVVWRNHEASLDTASLEPRTRLFSTYLLQEYFIPVENCVPFAPRDDPDPQRARCRRSKRFRSPILLKTPTHCLPGRRRRSFPSCCITSSAAATGQAESRPCGPAN